MRSFPKTLLGFYFRHGFRPYAFMLTVWTVLYLLFKIADGIFFPLYQKWFVALFEQPAPAGMGVVEFALPTIGLIVGLMILVDVTFYITNILSSIWSPKVQNRISEVLNDYLHRQSMTFWNNRMVGKINNQIGYVSGGFRTIVNFMRMLGSVVVIVIGSGMVVGINHNVAWVLGIMFVFRLAYSLAMMRPMNKASKNASDSSSALSGKVVDSISNFSIVKLFAGAKAEEKYLRPPRQKTVADRVRASFLQRMFWGIPMFVWDIGFGVIMAMCAMLYVSGDIKVSEIVFTLSIYFSVQAAIGNIVDQIPDMVDVIGSAQKSYEELMKPIDIMDAPNAPALRVTRGKIEIRNVSFSFGRRKVLDNLNIAIKPGEKVGLVGASGAGKTTLVNLLMRFYDPARGAILVDGQDIRGVTQDSLRTGIAFIPQEPTMFNRTLRENIGYGRADATIADIKRAAKRASADGFITETPKKYDSLVGDRGIKLSGGQRQRIAIARAFLKDAPILILDEATSALDSETEHVIQESFEKLSAGRTTIVIAHRLSTLRNMDRIVVMDRGAIAEQGTHAALLRRGGIYARLWRMQSGGFIKE